MNLIVPVAGESSRFPGTRPKWMLTHPNGNLMLNESLAGLDLKDCKKVFIIALKKHMEEYSCLKGIEKSISEQPWASKAELVLLENPTKSQPETVVEGIKNSGLTGPIFIKDADNFFNCKVTPRNEISVYDLSSVGLVNPGNKSYVNVDENNLVTNIVEKNIISSTFCVGGYGFESEQLFLEYFEKCKSHSSLYISHLIYSMILDEKAFQVQEVSNYIDWGTLEDWNRFKSEFATIFTDLDGVLVNNSSKFFSPEWGSSDSISSNVKTMNNLYDSGKVKIIITTSRSNSYKQKTEDQLKRLGIKYHQIIFDLFHSKRIIVNDYAATNPYKSCDAINIKRNSEELTDMLKDSMGKK